EDAAARRTDAWVLALPNGKAQAWVDALGAAQPDAVLLDLSADYRFDAAWYYGLPELTRDHYAGERRIANPGCYATAMQLALAPLVPLLGAPPVVFGVSGYSGAGTTPSPRNDPEALRDNLMPYAPIGHLHEREVSAQLDYPVRFMPHVAAFFRGIALTVDTTLREAATLDEINARFRDAYRDAPLVTVTAEAPQVKAAVGRCGAALGGFALSEDGTRLVLSATLDNLLKGAAAQALQNLNLACGFDELEGIDRG
ncbi:MAG: N-acetyl-gamma-glutamyl-phosphate reductase, partial [Pseudomonadota bacterium]